MVTHHLTGYAGRAGLCVLLVITAGLSQRAYAQWDPDDYEHITQMAQQLFRDAMALPDDAEDERGVMLIEAAEYMQAGQERLRAALITRDVDDTEARRDMYVLSENLMVVMLTLDQCAAAQLVYRDAVDHPEFLPEGSVEHLDSLSEEIPVCFARVNQARARWDLARYDTQLNEGDDWLARAHQSEPGSAQQQNYLFEAAESRAAAVDMLRSGVSAEEISPGDLEGATDEELYARHDELIGILVESRLCDAAQRRLDTARADIALIPAPSDSFVARRSADIDSCREEVGDSPSFFAGGSSNTDTTRLLSFILLGVAGASAITAFALDLSTGSDRDEFELLQSACAAGPCDLASATALSDSLAGRKVTVAIFTTLAVVTGVTGGLLLYTSRSEEGDQPDTTAAIAPFAGPQDAGVVFTLTY